jgi:hypothetical protein
MNEAAHDCPASATAAVPPSPSTTIPPPGPAEPGGADGGESWPEPPYANLPEALDAALAGTGLAGRDRQYLDRLVKWDKRNAASLVAVLWKARLAGRAEAAMKPRELGIVIGALRDSARCRESGADTVGCRDCEDVPGGRCQEHSKDCDRAQECTDLAATLTAVRAALGLPQPRGGAGYARPVAS